jgi:hypothetical protein
MTPVERDEGVEALLARDVRARLPLARQLLLYFNPFALFKDTSRGPAWMRERALSYNRAMRWMLLPYIRRWLLTATALFFGIAPAEALAAQASFFVVPAAALAVGCCVAITVAIWTLAVYVLLGPGPSR